MKIAHFTDSYFPLLNGVTISVDTLTRLLAGKHEVKVYAPAFAKTRTTERIDNLVAERFPSVSFPMYEGVHFALPNLKSIYESLKEFDPDVVHVHGSATMGLIGLIAGKRLKKPVVGTYHNLVSQMLVYLPGGTIVNKVKDFWSTEVSEVEFLSMGYQFVYGIGMLVGEEEINTEVDSPLQRVTWWAVNSIYNYCDLIVVPSAAIKRELLRRGIKRRVEVVSNGLDLKMFAPKTDYKINNQVIYVGRVSYEKKIDVVIKAFKYVADLMPECQLKIVGEGPAIATLRSLVKKLKLVKNVEFTGVMDRSKLSQIYLGSDVFVTASTMETQGLVILEAMASGLARARRSGVRP